MPSRIIFDVSIIEVLMKHRDKTKTQTSLSLSKRTLLPEEIYVVNDLRILVHTFHHTT